MMVIRNIYLILGIRRMKQLDSEKLETSKKQEDVSRTNMREPRK